MSEPNPETPKEWERFDEISLKKVSIVNEETPKPESISDAEKPETAEKVEKVEKVQEIDDPLQAKPEDEEVAKIEPTILKPAKNLRIPRIPAAPVVPPKKQIHLDVLKLEDGARVNKPGVISDPKNVNSKILATVYPDNVVCDWVTPPHYDARSMPSILAIDVPTLPGEDYIACIEAIILDSRFKMFSTIYARMIAIWMTFWIFLLAITLLFQSQGGWPVMIWCFIWAILLFVGVYVCAMIRRRIRIGLNHVVEKANKIIVDRHFLVGVEDRGQLSCHKVVIHFIRFNVGECTADVIKQLKIRSSGGAVFGNGQQTEMNDESIEREAANLILKYSQEYVKSVVKKRLVFPSKPIFGVSNYSPKHCKTQMCLCQFIDDKKFNAKPKKWYERYI